MAVDQIDRMEKDNAKNDCDLVLTANVSTMNCRKVMTKYFFGSSSELCQRWFSCPKFVSPENTTLTLTEIDSSHHSLSLNFPFLSFPLLRCLFCWVIEFRELDLASEYCLGEWIP